DGIPNLLLKRLICSLERCVHADTNYLFREWWQLSRNVLQGNEGRKAHQELAEQQWRGTGPAFNLLGYARFRATVVRRLDGRDLFQHTIGFGEGTESRFTPLVSAAGHFASLQPIQEI